MRSKVSSVSKQDVYSNDREGQKTPISFLKQYSITKDQTATAAVSSNNVLAPTYLYNNRKSIEIKANNIELI